jgi:hypothetical protein
VETVRFIIQNASALWDQDTQILRMKERMLTGHMPRLCHHYYVHQHCPPGKYKIKPCRQEMLRVNVIAPEKICAY